MLRTHHVGRDETGQVQHGVAIQAQIVPDHPVGNLLWHLPVGHFVHGKTFGSETAAVDRRGDFVFVVIWIDLEILHALDEWGIGRFVVGD